MQLLEVPPNEENGYTIKATEGRKTQGQCTAEVVLELKCSPTI